MRIELQCSNCGNRLSLEPTDFWRDGWRFTGVPYCPHCIKSWKERNGQEWNEQHDEEKMKDKFYEYLFDKIEREQRESEEYKIYENKDNISKDLKEIKDKILDIKKRLDDSYQDLNDSFVYDLSSDNKRNVDLVDDISNELEEVTDEIDDFVFRIEEMEIY